MSGQWAFLVALVGLSLGAFSGGAVGMGFPIVAVPAMTLGFGLETAVVVSALPTLAIDVINLYDTRDQRRSATGLVTFGVIAVASALVGSAARGFLDERILVILLATTISLLLLLEFLPTIDLSGIANRSTAGVAAASISGFLQATVAVSGPIIGIYFLNRTSSRRSFIFHVTTMFVLVGSVRSIVLVSTGSFSSTLIGASIGAAALALIGRAIGFKIGSRLNPRNFRRGVMMVLAISLVLLIFQAFTSSSQDAQALAL